MDKRKLSVLAATVVSMFLMTTPAQADKAGTGHVSDSVALQEVVVTGSRHAVDVRHLPMTVTVISREKLTEQHQASILPTALHSDRYGL